MFNVLRVTVEVIPGGIGKPQEIATLRIGNVSDLQELSDYVWYLYKDGAMDWDRRGFAYQHRRADGWAPLVKRILEQLDG